MSQSNRQSRRSAVGRSPTEALAIARGLLRVGHFHVGDVELPNELADLGYPGNELMHEALQAAFEEVSSEAYTIDKSPQSPPAYIFIWRSRHFQRRVFLKFKLKGTAKKPVLWIYSCHEAHF